MKDKWTLPRVLATVFSTLAIAADYIPYSIGGLRYAIVFLAPALIGVVTLLCAVTNKRLPIIFMSLLMGGMTFLVNLAVTSSYYSDFMSWIMSCCVYCPLSGLLLICGVWMTIRARKDDVKPSSD